METILIIDTGSSSMKGLLFDHRGNLLMKKQIKYQMDIMENDDATMPSEIFLTSMDTILSRAAEFLRSGDMTLSAISLTSQRSSVLPVNKEGYPLSPVIMWYDKRSTAICEQLNQGHGKDLHRISGMNLSPLCSAPKISWLKIHEPSLYERSHKILGIQDYLLYLLTGNFITDVSLASRTCLLDIVSLTWSEELIRLFNLDRHKLCDLAGPGSVAGRLTPAMSARHGLPAFVPVISAGGDQQCSLLGQGVYQEGEVGITSGTGSYVTAPLASPIPDLKTGLNLNASCIPGTWVLESSNLGSGSVYDWFLKNFYTSTGDLKEYEAMNKEISRISPGADGVLCIPSLIGSGTPDWDSFARGSFHNIGLATTRAHFARALLEGICGEIALSFLALQNSLPKVHTVKSSGGLTSFPCFNQILADMLNLPVEVREQAETTALGAWITSCITLQLVENFEDALKLISRNTSPYVYQPHEAAHELYLKQFQVKNYLKNQISTKELYFWNKKPYNLK